MMKKSKNPEIMKKFFAITILTLLMPMMLGAQALKGSYFLDNSLNRNKLNPAFAPRSAYWQIPVAGNLSAGVLGNLDMQTFLYPMNGQLYTFLNKAVTAEQFEKALAKNPYIDASADVNLLNFGFKSAGGFWTVDVGVRTNADVDLPADLFLFMKKGTGSSSAYNIGSAKMNISASVQAAIGYSRDMSDLVPGLSVGGKLRAILPAAYVGLDLKNVKLTTTPEAWNLETEGTLHAAMKGIELTDADGNISPDFKGPYGLAGFGMSFDLGAVYRMNFDGFINGVEFSAAFTDLGFVKYGASDVKAYKSQGNIEWTGMQIALDGKGTTDSAVDELGKELEKLLEFEKTGEGEALTRSTVPNFYVGVEMPFCNNKMSVGALYSARKSYHFTRNELTLSYNFNPTKWFGLGLNYSFLNVVKTIGGMIEFTPRVGLNFFLGCDYFPLELAPIDDFMLPWVPTAARLNLHTGLAFSFGKKDKK